MAASITQPASEYGYSRREQRGWYMYDWANSAFSATVATVFMGPYVTSLAKNAADAQGYVHPFGIPILYSSFWPYVVSLSVLVQVFFLPLLGALADYAQMKKQMLAVFGFGGAALNAAMFFLQGDMYLLGGFLFLTSNLAFGASVVFYGAFLPEIAPPEERDAVSSKGYGIGYLGGGLLLLLNLILFTKAKSLGISEALAVRICLASAGVWWGLFTIIPIATLRQRSTRQSLPPGESYLTIGFHQFAHTLKSIFTKRNTLLFLVGYLLYNDGIQTVITLASTFGQEELKLSDSVLTSAILMVQFVAFFGSMIFNFLAKVMGAKRAVLLSLLIWTGTLFYIYFFVYTELQFYIMAAIVAIILGGSQALSRSLFSQMVPEGKESEYFSLYEISDRGTSWLGPLVFGLANQITHSYRIAIVSLIIFFILGMTLLAKSNIEQATLEAKAG